MNNVYMIDFEKLCDVFIDTIEDVVFSQNEMHQSFSLSNKEEIKKAMNLFLERTFSEYEIVEIKNSFVEEQKEKMINEKKTFLH